MIELELSILDGIQSVFKSPIFDALMPWITKLGDHGIIPILFCAILIVIPKTRRFGLILATGMILCFLIVNVSLKPVIARARPYTYNDFPLLITAPTDYSFPSGHSAIFATMTAGLYYARSRFTSVMMITAALVVFSRLYLYVHFPSDVLAGIIIGWICGYLGWKIYEYSKRSSLE